MKIFIAYLLLALSFTQPSYSSSSSEELTSREEAASSGPITCPYPDCFPEEITSALNGAWAILESYNPQRHIRKIGEKEFNASELSMMIMHMGIHDAREEEIKEEIKSIIGGKSLEDSIGEDDTTNLIDFCFKLRRNKFKRSDYDSVLPGSKLENALSPHPTTNELGIRCKKDANRNASIGLIQACIQGSVEAARLCINRGADVNCRTDSYNKYETPLHFIAQHHASSLPFNRPNYNSPYLRVADLLIKEKADVNALNIHKKTLYTCFALLVRL